MTVVHTSPNAPRRQFGAIPRPFDLAEIKYSYAFRPPATADFSTPVGMAKDQRSKIWDQGSTSSCTASICEALETAALYQQRPIVQLSHEHVYYEARARRDFFGQGRGADTGAYVADVCDVALQGIGREDLHPFDGSVWDEPSTAVVQDRVHQVWAVRHRPIYTGPGAMAQVWDALSHGWPVILGWVLDASMYDPPSRPYPRGLNPQASGQHGFHQSSIYRMRRHSDGRVYIGGPNSWGERFYNPRITEWWPEEARPGEFWADAEDWLERTTSPVFELRALEMHPYVVPQPEPEPEPDMQQAIEVIRRREQEQYALEAQYYAQGDRYRGDAAWWAAVQLGEAAKELETFGLSAMRLQPRGPEAA